MNNKDRIHFAEITYGSYAFRWSVAKEGYSLLDESTHKYIGDKIEVVDDGPQWLVRQGDMVRQYPPLSKPTLHREFARLNSEESTIRFANKYGLLGNCGVILGPRGRGAVVLGESVARWRQESQNIGMLLAIWDLVAKKYAGKLGQLIKWPLDNMVVLEMQVEYDETLREWRVQPWSPIKDEPSKPGGAAYSETIASDHIHTEVLSRWRRGHVIEPAKYHVLREVNKRLKGHVSPQVLLPKSKEDSPSKVYLFPDSLLTSLWLMFLMEIIGRIRVRQCDFCGNWKEVIRTRNSFYCGNACRQAAFRKKNRHKAKPGRLV